LLGFSVLTSDISHQDHLKRLVTLNLAEIELLPTEKLPEPGSCIVRRSNNLDQLVTTLNQTGAACQRSAVQGSDREITWVVSGISEVDAKFSHAHVMKLPSRNNSLVQVQVRASMLQTNGNGIKTIIFTTFKG